MGKNILFCILKVTDAWCLIGICTFINLYEVRIRIPTKMSWIPNTAFLIETDKPYRIAVCFKPVYCLAFRVRVRSDN
jgi:hypothetical protein